MPASTASFFRGSSSSTAIGSRAKSLARDALAQLAGNVPTSSGSRLLRLQGLLAPVFEALEVRRRLMFFVLFSILST